MKNKVLLSFRFAEIFRERMVSWMAESLLFPFARLTMKQLVFPFSIDQLLALAPNTIGHALGKHMRQNAIEFIPGFESHDIKHMLSGYSIKVTGEIQLAAFELGNGIYSPTNLLVFVFGIFWAPDCWGKMNKAFIRGRKTGRFVNLNSIDFLLKDFEAIKMELNLAPL